MRPLLLITLLIISSLNSNAQDISSNWTFGQMAGLSWNTGTPQEFTSGITSDEGCASISDRWGNLLFYTDGVTVWNNINTPMPNSLPTSPGGTLVGFSSSTQSALIIPKPLDSTYYYIFTTGNDLSHDGYYYTGVNMNENAGLGDIDPGQKNIQLVTSSCEKLCATYHANGTDIWVITHPFNSGDFQCFLVTDSGINTTPVISTTGIFVTGGFEIGYGYMKMSPDGSLIAAANQALDKYELYTFDNATGTISLLLSMPSSYQHAYGVEFSPDGSKLYGSMRFSNKIYQWDVSSNVPGTIMASQAWVATLSTNFGGAIQAGPDDKLYIARKNQPYLSVVNNPNENGINCNFTEVGVSLGTNSSREGLPSFLHDLDIKAIIGSANYCVDSLCQFEALQSTWLDSVRWDFGDPFSANNNSDSINSTHVYTQAGTYEVSLYVYNGIFVDSTVQSIVIDGYPSTNLIDTTICEGSSIQLSAQADNGTFLWSNGSVDSTITVSTAGDYYITVSNACATINDTMELNITPVPLVGFSTDSISISIPYELIPFTINTENYLWSTGSTDSVITVSSTGWYYITVSNSIICTDVDSIYVNYLTAIQNINSENRFALYPNPANKQLNVKLFTAPKEDATISIFNTSGQCVYIERLDTSHSSIDISNLAPGIYYVSLLGEQTRISIIR